MQSFRISRNKLHKDKSSSPTGAREENMSRKKNVSPVDDEALVRGLFVTNGTDPGGLLLVHLQVQSSVETLQVRAGDCAARHRQTHLTQLKREGEYSKLPQKKLRQNNIKRLFSCV